MPRSEPVIPEQAAKVVQSVWDLFFATGSWPTVGDVARYVDRRYDIELEAAVKHIPASYLYGVDPVRLPADGQPFGLRLAGIVTVRGADDEIQTFVKAVRLAAELDRSWTPPPGDTDALPQLTPAVLTANESLPAAGRAELVGRVGVLLLAENWGWSSASMSTPWQFAISRSVRRFRDVADAADYLARDAAASASHTLTPDVSALPIAESEEHDEMGSQRRAVFVVHGRDAAAKRDLVLLLNALDLRVISWRDAAAQTGGGTPYTGDIVTAGMDMADAVVVLLTPDDVGFVRSDYRDERDGPDELRPTGQARLNVIFEAGMAMARDRTRVVLVEVGATRSLSDTAGLNVVRLKDGVESRKDFASRLTSAGLDVRTDGEEWRTVGTFTRALLTARDLSPASANGDDALTPAEQKVLAHLADRFSADRSALQTPIAVPGLEWEEIADVLGDLHAATPPYLEGQMVAELGYPVVVTRLTERGRRASRS